MLNELCLCFFFQREHNFDGLDINWQFPGLRGGSEKDKVNFPLLLKVIEKYDLIKILNVYYNII